MGREPAAIVGAITTVVAAILVFLDEFGVELSEDQQSAINKLVAVVAPIIAAIVIRQLVVSPAAAGEAVAIAKTISPTSAVVPEVRVQSYKAAVVEHLPGVTTESQVDWRPPVDAH